MMSAVPQSQPQAYLSINNVEVIYDHVILVLRGVSLEVPEGQIVALLGANGAGKTTTLKAISNLLRAERGEVTKGQILFQGERIDQLNPSELVRRGICQVMEGRHCFQHLTVEENLLTGAYPRRGADLDAELDKVYSYFPRLKDRSKSQSGYTSGGEQQMTAIGRALMARPKMILLDEPSMGLAPQLVRRSDDGLSAEVPAARLWSGLLAAVPVVLAGLVIAQVPHLEWVVVAGLAVFGVAFAINSSVHSYLILAYAGSEKAAEDVGFYYAANALGRFFGTLMSGLLYQHFGLVGALAGSAAMLVLCWAVTLSLPVQRGLAAATPAH